MPMVEFVRPDSAAMVCGVIKPGHTMISINDKTLLGIPLSEAARYIGESAQKTKDSNGKIPCVIRFLKTDAPEKKAVEKKSLPDPMSNAHKPIPRTSPKLAKGAKTPSPRPDDDTEETEGKQKKWGCFPGGKQ